MSELFSGQKFAVQYQLLKRMLALNEMDIEGEIPAEFKAAAYKKLAQSIDTPQTASRFYFGGGC
ncbi:hypothetical protein V6615_14065 [Oscillospiraceae bacterium PP1C4]